jgi:hypothetical protein
MAIMGRLREKGEREGRGGGTPFGCLTVGFWGVILLAGDRAVI